MLSRLNRFFILIAFFLKKRFTGIGLTAALLLACSHAIAEGDAELPDLAESKISITTQDPQQTVGYNVGDIIERHITIETDKAVKLVPTSLPIVGYQKRYKGQATGIEVSAIRHTADESGQKNRYTVDVTYQIFTRSPTAKPARVPPELITLSENGKFYKASLPPFYFRISPLAVYGAVKVEDDMSPLRGPLLLDATRHHTWLRVWLGVLALALLGLLYILGTVIWLPMLGRPFARALRNLNHLQNTPQQQAEALQSIHHALNQTAGFSVFAHNVQDFIATQPQFAPAQADLQRFFSLSGGQFFASSQATLNEADWAWLRTLCRRCRDCERHLQPTPETAAA